MKRSEQSIINANVLQTLKASDVWVSKTWIEKQRHDEGTDFLVANLSKSLKQFLNGEETATASSTNDLVGGLSKKINKFINGEK